MFLAALVRRHSWGRPIEGIHHHVLRSCDSKYCCIHRLAIGIYLVDMVLALHLDCMCWRGLFLVLMLTEHAISNQPARIANNRLYLWLEKCCEWKKNQAKKWLLVDTQLNGNSMNNIFYFFSLQISKVVTRRHWERRSDLFQVRKCKWQ